MKTLLQSYADYNRWANSLLLDAVAALPPDVQEAQHISSFASLSQTALHLLDAESIWWQRLKLAEKIVRPSEGFSGDFRAVADALRKQDRTWLDWLSETSEKMLQHEFIYYNSKKEPCKNAVWQMLLHLFNHSTFHRGQLITLLRQSGVTKLPETDYLAWCRKKG
ncbi:MAG: hypothetical protein JWP27_3004 [Flaviaesturariibacter sp.]|nr:hypothetical protein [Flaviaesturariibacter sp.]